MLSPEDERVPLPLRMNREHYPRDEETQNLPRNLRQPTPKEVHIPFDIQIYESKNQAKFPKMPKFISEYCITYDRQMQLGRMRAKKLHDRHLYQRPNTFSFDLNAGFETFDPKQGEEGLAMILRWIEMMSPEGGRLKKVIHEADVVCWRGLLTRLGATIYNKEDSWKFKAVRRKGVIFLMEEKTELAIRRENEQSDREKRMCYWGHKFEQYVTKEDDAEEPDTSGPVTTKEEYGVVFQNDLLTDTRLNPDKRYMGILYSGEVDCLDKCGSMVELKTQKGPITQHFYRSGKSLKWWLQSSLINISKIIVGHRDDEGQVKMLSTLRVKEIGERVTWNYRACFDFISTILTHVLNCLERDGEACLVEYGAEFGIHKGLKLRRVNAESCDFVPASFLEKYT